MAQDGDASVIVRSVIDLARNLNLRVVAEGVETAEICDRLRQLGCDQLQGYFLGRPMPIDEFELWLAEAPWTWARRATAGPQRQATPIAVT
jgi:EAL domain-containing protein (putative c-di-GMP-specific phosphodiesterase class I)